MTPQRRAVTRTRAGTADLLTRCAAWMTTDDWRETTKRILAVIGAGWMLGGMILAAPILLAPTAAAWLAAAWRTGRQIEQRERNEQAFVQLVRDLIGDRNGVLLADVATTLQTARPGLDIGHVRAQCEALDIPVRDKLKVDGRVSVGVHVDDLTAVWDVDPTPAPPTGRRAMHPSVTSDDYPTTPDLGPLPEGDVDHEQPAGEVTT